MSFQTLGLSPELLRAIGDQGYTEPSPIQRKVIPVILSGALNGPDVMARAQTGTGKTAGYTLPLLHLLSQKGGAGGKRQIKALILTPTRELAAQVSHSVRTYGKYLPLRSSVIFGGVNINPQIDHLRRGVDILVATPGRLLDHVRQRTLDLSQIEHLVLDEADRMLDMGFIKDIRTILSLLPRSRQNLLFSATFSDEIKKLAADFLQKPVSVEAEHNIQTADRIVQEVYIVDRGRKRELLSHLIGANNLQQVLVFTRTKHGSDRLADQLERDGLYTAVIHGGKSQGARTRALEDFKRKRIQVLVATDIAARGLDINNLPFVINFELPFVPEDYVHRIGRTGRAGNEGKAISLVCADDRGLLMDIERHLKLKFPVQTVPGYEPTPGSFRSASRPEQSSGYRRKPTGAKRSWSNTSRNKRSSDRSRRS